MIKLSDAMVKGLRLISEGRSGVVPIRTCEALRSRFLATPGAKTQTYEITQSGKDVLARLDRAEREAQEAAERASRPVPAGAFVEPSARTAPVMPVEYEDETPGECGARLAYPGRSAYVCEREPHSGGDHRGTNGTAVAAWDDRSPHALPAEYEGETPGEPAMPFIPPRHTNSPIVVDVPYRPAVRLTPAKPGAESEATDGAILQLLALMDAGARVSRRLYGMFTIENPDEDGPAFAFPLNTEQVDRAARDAVRFGLARQTFRDRAYHLEAEPVHRARAQYTACGRYIGPSENRLRVTTDPSKVTHEKCKH